MATHSSKNGLPQFFAEDGSADSIRRQIAEGPMEAAKQSAFATAVELFAVMSVLPDAFIASQERELERLRGSGKEAPKDPRIDALKASIAQADALRATAQLGQARVERALVAMTDSDQIFHGFVSDTELQPLSGLTVRVTGRDGSDGKALSGKTGKDGYFRIRLGDGSRGTKTHVPESTVNLSGRLAELLATVNAGARDGAGAKAEARAATAGDGKDVLARVEILDGAGALVHQDDAPLIVNAGSAYREYVIGDGERANAGDYKELLRKAAKPADAAPATAASAKPAAPTGDKAKAKPAAPAKKTPGKGKK